MCLFTTCISGLSAASQHHHTHIDMDCPLRYTKPCTSGASKTALTTQNTHIAVWPCVFCTCKANAEVSESAAHPFTSMNHSTWMKTGCLLPSSAPKAASIPNMAALELMSSGRSPENDMMSAEHIRGLTQQVDRWALHSFSLCIPMKSSPLVCSKGRAEPEDICPAQGGLR